MESHIIIQSKRIAKEEQRAKIELTAFITLFSNSEAFICSYWNKR